uniref:histidine kinase n=1 Tax=Solibacter usitatus (strain Ellin6076) TaxID=234267 RepID=Q026N9_SOLUE
MRGFKSDRELSEFLLRACHDVRAAARAVRTHSELILKDAAAGKSADLEIRANFIVGGASRIDALTNGLAAFAIALQTDPGSFQVMRVDVLVRTVIAKLGPDLRAAAAVVEYGELPQVLGSPDRLMQVFEQLLRNALVHRGEDPPRVSIQAAKHAEGWLFTVRDNGPGLEAESLESIFRPFERLNSNGGAGLGLAICREIIQRHGGRIWAESAPGGTTICFTLPD